MQSLKLEEDKYTCMIFRIRKQHIVLAVEINYPVPASPYTVESSKHYFREYFKLCPWRASTLNLKRYLAIEMNLNKV